DWLFGRKIGRRAATDRLEWADDSGPKSSVQSPRSIVDPTSLMSRTRSQYFVLSTQYSVLRWPRVGGARVLAAMALALLPLQPAARAQGQATDPPEKQPSFAQVRVIFAEKCLAC